VRVVVLAGTSKGLFLIEGDERRDRSTVADPVLEGWSVFHAMLDPRDGGI
jgi:hypothetical protein